MSQRLTITFDDDLLEILRSEAEQKTAQQKRGKISIAQLINQQLGAIYADQIAELRKEKLRQRMVA